MKHCAFLTLNDPVDFIIDDTLAYEPFRAMGWQVEAVPWRQTGSDWSVFDAVVIRSTWDYQHAASDFLQALESIEGSGTPLLNELNLVRWNIRKTYLQDLSVRGVPTVPSVRKDRLTPGGLESLMEEADAGEVIVKPAIGANADGTYRLDRTTWELHAPEVERYFAHRAVVAQPFARSVLDEGEYSLVYFSGTFSHAVLKKPAAGDFRVQEQHGGVVHTTNPGEELLAAGDAAIRALGEPPLYARADLVRANDGDGFWVMELELIEPSLYLGMDPQAPERFAAAFRDAVPEGPPSRRRS